MDATDRAALRVLLARRYPWVVRTDLGPRSVEAGECDGCGAEARLVMTCGPGADVYLGRRCARARGEHAWCDGHHDDAEAALGWLVQLPEEADAVARLWWVATGEVTLDPDLVARTRRRLGLPG